MSRFLLPAALGLLALSTSAHATTIGSLDTSRVHIGFALTGSKYEDVLAALLDAGNEAAAPTRVVTSDYLAAVDVFVTGLPAILGTTAGYAAAAEITALQAWVQQGGVLVLGGDNQNFTAAANSWMTPFGLTLVEASLSGGIWGSGPDALLAGEVAGADLGFGSGGYFAPGDYDVLATIGENAAVVQRQYGRGLVIGLGDGNFFDDPASTVAESFFVNIASVSRAMNLAATPLPASLPLLAGGVGALLALRRRRQVCP
ncbi:VPLPA-CTERM sorting domain-containing protein [Tropicimonas sp. IMCC34043]|uniref:VPLPA-CTERM sorting domain-containing protein n=1 Tax=Tropicimonas sp. IMCC34043 TaxID=2248760 RepID=UPI000E21CA62|nr:VPLPA-CTERM sorting domain-containing protein [Tropicimonas sp. IMCC34043]